MMPMPLSDIYDRLSILMLKWLHGMDVKEELLFYSSEFTIDERFLELMRVNYEIWKLESDIRNGKFDAERKDPHALIKVGTRALEIRDWNRQRVAIKNRIASEEGSFSERKVDHASS